MKTYSLQPQSDVTRRLIKFNRRYNIREFTTDGSTYSGAIAITDGTPDDVLTFLLCSHLNGDLVSAMFKPVEGTRFGSMQGILNLIGPKISAFLMVLDREDESIDEIRDSVETYLRDHGCTFEREHIDDYLIYRCSRGPHTFTFLVVVNGLEHVNTRNHCVEDHLVYAGGLDGNGDSKGTWRSLSNQERNTIISELARSSRQRLIDVFPQHIEALEIFKDLLQTPAS